jgi:hypothetical protein
MTTLLNYFTVKPPGTLHDKLSHEIKKVDEVIQKPHNKLKRSRTKQFNLIDDEAELSGEETEHGDECESTRSSSNENDEYEKDSFLASEDDLSSVSAEETPQPRTVAKKATFQVNTKENYRSLESYVDEYEESLKNPEEDTEDPAKTFETDNPTRYQHFKFDGSKDPYTLPESTNKKRKFNACSYYRQFSGKSDEDILDFLHDGNRPENSNEMAIVAMLKDSVPFTTSVEYFDKPDLPESCLGKRIGAFKVTYRL